MLIPRAHAHPARWPIRPGATAKPGQARRVDILVHPSTRRPVWHVTPVATPPRAAPAAKDGPQQVAHEPKTPYALVPEALRALGRAWRKFRG